MKRETLLLFVMSMLITSLQAQKKQSPLTGYAITAAEKGGKGWKEVRQINIETGEELRKIYSNADGMEALNARTGKPVQVKAVKTPVSKTAVRKVINLDQELAVANGKVAPVYKVDANGQVHAIHQSGTERVIIRTKVLSAESADKPFATNSAAMAYDKKHERLYYTPMGINQLRYIDLKAKSPKVYYFEEEAFGTVTGLHDAPAQITRMVIASDGNGYALSNDGKHLVRFTTGRKPSITDLGTLTDDGNNPAVSVHSRNNYGGDMIADASGNLYLFTANRQVFKINIETKMASYQGIVKGLPRGFSTNGAMVEEGSKVIVASSESTVGYYRVDLNTLQAEKVSSSATVFNASDLANGNLAFAKKKKDTKEPEETQAARTQATEKNETAKGASAENPALNKGISVFPNPVVNSLAKLSFTDQPAGKYQVQVLDLGGRTVTVREVNIANKVQVVDLSLPELAKGTYLVRIVNEPSDVYTVTKIIVQ
jgi:hypothetical protein